jgi:hypothetical protein
MVRARRPSLLTLTAQALGTGGPLLRPKAVFERFSVRARSDERVELAGGGSLHGRLIAEQLQEAEAVVVAICTVGEAISVAASERFAEDPALSVCLDGLGSAAAEALAGELCRRLDEQAAAEGLRTGMPLNPGMLGWPVEVGQPQIFALLDAAAIGVTLESSALMRPLKSLSFVMGIGKHLHRPGETCDYCGLRNSCRYRGVQPAEK